MLLERDDLILDHRDVLGQTPKDVAIRKRKTEMVQLLEQRGA